jgi:hypothetical protein
VPVAVYSFVGGYVARWNLIFAGLAITIAPILAFYLSAQGRFPRPSRDVVKHPAEEVGKEDDLGGLGRVGGVHLAGSPVLERPDSSGE